MNSGKHWSQKLEAQWAIPGILGFLYTVGFLVTNSHRAAYQPVQVELFEAQYIGAALLYTMLTVLSISIAVHAHRAGERQETPAQRLRTFLARLGIGLAVLVLLLWTITPNPEPFPEGLVHSLSPFGYCGAVVGVVVVKLALDANRRGDSSKGDVEPARIWMGLFMLLFGSTVLFGLIVYPRVSPVFGGGAKWIAMVDLEGPNPNGYALADSVMILDVSGGFRTLLSCVEDTDEGEELERDWTVLAIPDSNVQAIRYARMASPGAYIGHLERFGCADRRATGAQGQPEITK